MKVIKFSIFTFIILLFGSILYAQDVSITASVSKNQLPVEGQFQYSVEVSGQSTSLPEVTFPDFKDFYVLSGPNTSTSIQFINGAMASSKTYSFYLRPRKEGKLVIGKASLDLNGKTITTEEITVTVKKGGTSTSQSGVRDAPKSRSDADIAGETLYLKTVVSKKNVFLGEQIIVEYKLYFRVNVRGYNLDKYPANAGFWTEEFKMPPQPSVENEIINGLNFNVATLKKAALFPTQSGKLKIEPIQVTLEAVVKERRKRRSIFDSFFDDPFGRTVQKTITSKPISIKVSPLPEEGKPPEFNGTVGRYKFNTSIDKNEAHVNEAVSLKIRLSGVGNIGLTELPIVQIPPDIEKYDPKITSQVKNEGNRISGSKSAEYILIPRITGQYKIKPISFSYFDPRKKSYQTIVSNTVELNVLEGSGTVASFNPQTGGYSRQEVTLLGQDIRFIKEYSSFNLTGYRPYLSTEFFISIFSALILFCSFVIINDYKARLSGNEQLVRSRKAGKIASRHLSVAKKQLNNENQSEFYKAISQALQGFVQDKLNIELTDFSLPNIRKVLKQKGIAEEEIEEYLSVLEESDFRQFANKSAPTSERRQFFKQAVDALTKFEKWI